MFMWLESFTVTNKIYLVSFTARVNNHEPITCSTVVLQCYISAPLVHNLQSPWHIGLYVDHKMLLSE